MDDSDWERVLELARGYDDGCTPREYADQQRRRGEPERLCRLLETHLALGDVPADPDERWAAQQVGARIDIRAHLQDGGAGSVYLGVLDPKGRAQPVAVKMFRLQHSAGARAAAREAWLRERDLLEEFSKKGRVAPLVEAGEHRAEDGTEYLYLCTEYKHGANLAQWCRQHGLSPAVRLQLFAQVCDAVAQIHSHGLVHGDLKPANIQVEAQDGGARAWILDLGLIAVRGRVWRRLGEGLVGTPGYMSPEQIASDGVVGDATDVYALGAMLFELLEERPFLVLPARLDADSLLQALQKRPAPELGSGMPEAVRAALQAAVRRATALDPRERYPQVCVLSEVVRGVLPALLAAEREAVPAQSVPGAAQASTAGRDRVIWLTALLLGFTALLVFALVPSSRLDAVVRQLLKEEAFALECAATELLPGESDADCIARRIADRIGVDAERIRPLLRGAVLSAGADPAASELERARAAYLTGEYAEAQRLALRSGAAAGEGSAAADEAASGYEIAGWAALQRQEYRDAQRYLDQAELRQAQWDRDHGLNAVAGARLRYARAFALYRSGDARAAAELLRPMLVELAARLGAEHPASQRARGLLAAALLAAGQPAQAAAELRELIALRERLLGAQHRDTLQSRHNLAIALAQLGERSAAESEYRSLLPAFDAAFGPEYRATLQLRLNLAALLQSGGRSGEAEREYGELCELFEHLLGADHPDTLSCREYRAMALAALQRSAEAESLLLAVLETRERTLGPTHTDTLRSRQNLALLLSQLPGRQAEAEAHCRSALRGASANLGREHPLTLASQRLLAQILSERGDYAQAESEYRKLLASYENGEAGATRDQLQPALRGDIAGVYVGLSWAQLLGQRPGDALKAADDGLSWAPSDLPLLANRAHALLLLGRADEALRLYTAHRGEPLRADEPKLWEAAVLEDLAALERSGVTHPGFARVRGLLGQSPGHSA